MRANMKQIFALFFILFSTLAVYLGKLVFFDAGVLASNSYNRRMSLDDVNVKRGNIISSDKVLVAFDESVYGGGYLRKYPYPEAFCHITGFLGHGKSAVELKYNFTLTKLNSEVSQRFWNIMGESELEANSVALTVNAKLQIFVQRLLKDSGYNGAAVVIEPSTGKILAMCSTPDFDSNEVSYNWDNLIKDENTPLLNRAAQGLYPPGSTFKIITAAALIEKYPAYENYIYNCNGTAVFDDIEIRCYDSTWHGEVDLNKAFTVSCNGYFASLNDKLRVEWLGEVAEKFMFNNQLGYVLDYKMSSFVANRKSERKELLDTYYGQGKTLVTPLQMALCAAAIYNNGVMMKPYAVEKTMSYYGEALKTTEPEVLAQPISEETAAILKEMMINVVENGTGKAAKTEGVIVAGKTGTAQNSSGKDHSWFVSFSDNSENPMAVSIILEGTGGGSKAADMAGSIYNFSYNAN